MDTTGLRKVGGSIMLTVPPTFLHQLQLQAGATVGITVSGGHLIIDLNQSRATHLQSCWLHRIIHNRNRLKNANGSMLLHLAAS